MRSLKVLGRVLWIWIVSFFCVWYMTHYGVNTLFHFDLYLAFPIAKAIADPTLYSQEDLLIASGLRTPFHVYHALGYLFQKGWDVDYIWHCGYILSLWLYFMGVWLLSFEIGRSTLASHLTVAFLACIVPYRGSLNATEVPLGTLVTAQCALPIAMYALVMLFRSKYLISLILSALVFNIHPYVGLILLTATGTTTLLEARSVSLGRRFFWMILTGLVALTNVIYILIHLPENFRSESSLSDALSFYEQFQIYADHVFIEHYWKEGYGWFFLHTSGLFFFLPRFSPTSRRKIYLLVAVFLMLIVFYEINIYLFQYKPILLMFLFRVAYFLKPLLLIVIVNGTIHWLNAGSLKPKWMRGVRYGVVLGMFISAIHPDLFISEVILLICYSTILLLEFSSHPWAQTIGIAFVGIALLELFGAKAWIDGSVTLHVICSIVFMFIFLKRTEAVLVQSSQRSDSRRALWPLWKQECFALIVVLLIFVSTVLIRFASTHEVETLRPFSKAKRSSQFRISTPNGHMAPLITWIRHFTPKGSLFLVPPLDIRFHAFRLTAQRSAFITLYDINQLSMDASVYHEGHNRLKKIGLHRLGRRHFAANLYHQIPVWVLKDLHKRFHVDYAVFDRSKMGTHLTNLPGIYKDSDFVVLDLRFGEE